MHPKVSSINHFISFHLPLTLLKKEFIYYSFFPCLNRLYNTKPVQSTLDNLIKKNKRIQINKNKDIDTANKLAVEKGRFQKGNEYRFQKNPNNVTKDQIGLNFDELEREL